MKLLIICVLCVPLVLANPVPPPAASQYIDCIPGTLNVILGAPHGGNQEPSNIPDRDAGCYINGACVYEHDCGAKDSSRCSVTTGKDMYTWELTDRIAYYLEDLTGQAPTQAINKLHRKKLDANREKDEATFGVPDAEEAFDAFHACINAAKAAIEASPEGQGMFFDIHGHGHPNNWAELGYLISGSNLDDGTFAPEDSSILHLANTVTDVDFETLLRGENSFGDLLEKNGFDAVPSPTYPSPSTGPNGSAYFSGGTNTRMHGSRDGGSIDAIQIESARGNRDPPMREAYAEAIAKSIVEYMTIHY